MGKSILVVYYSLEGNTEFVAKELAAQTDAELIRLEPVKEIPKTGFGKYFFGGKAALTHAFTHLKPIEAQVDAYEAIVLAGPVWAATYPPAIGTFLDEHRFSGKDVYLVATSKSGNAGKFFRNLESRLSGNRIRSVLSVTNPLKNQERAKSETKQFADSIREDRV
jgi:flavodoxin